MSSMTLAHTNGNGTTASVSNKAWLTLTAREFFSSINWDNNPPEVQELKAPSQESGAPLNLLLTVSQFFTAVNWDGMAIAPTPTPSTPAPPEKVIDFTLEDFSDLF
ncbi:MAG: hypothetical protein SFY66_22890 [Oculatellaceae cyanobacterium bins.114]|nr:hypothetical protein [Oculatellaceae cyanobacterium bins.114]